MTFGTFLASYGTIAFVLRHPKRGAYQRRSPLFAHVMHTRAKRRNWPFNAPRPNRPAESEYSAESSENPSKTCTGSVDPFAGFDDVHPAAHLDLDDEPILEEEQQSIPESAKPELSAAGKNQGSPAVDGLVSKTTPFEWQNDYQRVRQLAPSIQGQVDILKHKPSGKQVVVKRIKLSMNIRSEHLTTEASVLKGSLKPHPNLVKVHAVFFDRKPRVSNLIMEYCCGGDLFEFVEHWWCNKGGSIPEMFFLHFIASMREALGYLHLGQRFKYDDDVGMPKTISEAG